MDRVTFHYIKSNLYRVIHIDGAHGGLTPQGHVFAALYSERVPIPQSTVYKLVDDSVLGDEILEGRKTKDGIVREVEAGVEMDLSTAQALHKWLGDKIAELQKAMKETSGEKIG